MRTRMHSRIHPLRYEQRSMRWYGAKRVRVNIKKSELTPISVCMGRVMNVCAYAHVCTRVNMRDVQ